jgi:hypothetical protein
MNIHIGGLLFVTLNVSAQIGTVTIIELSCQLIGHASPGPAFASQLSNISLIGANAGKNETCNHDLHRLLNMEYLRDFLLRLQPCRPKRDTWISWAQHSLNVRSSN